MNGFLDGQISSLSPDSVMKILGIAQHHSLMNHVGDHPCPTDLCRACYNYAFVAVPEDTSEPGIKINILILPISISILKIGLICIPDQNSKQKSNVKS